MTKAVFVDSFAWIAAINKSDNYHDITLRIITDLLGKNSKLFTTNYVIIETINALITSSIYTLIALGFSFIYTTKFFYFAHREFMSSWVASQ